MAVVLRSRCGNIRVILGLYQGYTGGHIRVILCVLLGFY